MMPCILIGDSIAVGVGQARPECETVAQVGISSQRYIATMLPPGRTQADTAVISLGVNDDISLDTLDNLRTVRARVAANRVVWLLPGLKENVREMIRTVAAENGDRTLDTRPQVGRDHLHPNGAGYEAIASQAIGGASGVEVAYAPGDAAEEVRRPLRRSATPAERVHRLRAVRHAELGHGARRSVVPRHQSALERRMDAKQPAGHASRPDRVVTAKRISKATPLLRSEVRPTTGRQKQRSGCDRACSGKHPVRF